MIYQIDIKINDGKSEAPPYTLSVDHPTELDVLVAEGTITDELCNDQGEPLGVGATLTITQIA